MSHRFKRTQGPTTLRAAHHPFADFKALGRILPKAVMEDGHRHDPQPEKHIPEPGETKGRGPRRKPKPSDFDDTCIPAEGYHGEQCECYYGGTVAHNIGD